MKNKVEVRIHPSDKTEFDNTGWYIGNEKGSVQINNGNFAFCLTFGKKTTTLDVWETQENGDLIYPPVFEKKFRHNKR